MKSSEMARFDARLPKEQKKLFELASRLEGYRNLTEFVLRVVQIKAEEIVEKHNKIIASQKDQEVFFDLVFGDVPAPNQDLKSALEAYKKQL